MAIQGVTTFLWFDDQAEDAANFYVGLFPDSRVTGVMHYQEGSHRPVGSVQLVNFELFGTAFAALNGGPMFTHSEAVSFQVSCDTQEELDRIWDALIAGGGRESQCGWCVDRFGISWQVLPSRLGEILSCAHPEQVWQVMFDMQRLDIARLEAAARGE